MSRLRATDSLVVGAHVALGLIIALSGAKGATISRQLFKSLALGSFTAQAVLLGLWCGLSGIPAARRWTRGAIGVAIVWSMAVTALHGWLSGGAKIVLLLWLVVPFFAAAGMAAVLRHRGIYCQQLGIHLSDRPLDAIQFSLGRLFTVIAACAVLLTLTRVLRSLGQALSFAPFIVAGALLAVMFGVQMLACFWTAFGLGNWGRRVWFPLLIACAWPMLLAYATGHERSDYLEFLTLAMVQAILLLSTMLGLRFAGYRLVHQGRNGGTSRVLLTRNPSATEDDPAAGAGIQANADDQ